MKDTSSVAPVQHWSLSSHITIFLNKASPKGKVAELCTARLFDNECVVQCHSQVSQ